MSDVRTVGTRSRAIRGSTSDDRVGVQRLRWSARPARRRWMMEGSLPYCHRALASAHGRNGKRLVVPCNAGRAGVYRPSEALHLTAIIGRAAAKPWERVLLPTVLHVAETRRLIRYANPRRPRRERIPTGAGEVPRSYHSSSVYQRSRRSHPQVGLAHHVAS